MESVLKEANTDADDSGTFCDNSVLNNPGLTSRRAEGSNSFCGVGHIYMPQFYAGRNMLKKFKQVKRYIFLF